MMLKDKNVINSHEDLKDINEQFFSELTSEEGAAIKGGAPLCGGRPVSGIQGNPIHYHPVFPLYIGQKLAGSKGKVEGRADCQWIDVDAVKPGKSVCTPTIFESCCQRERHLYCRTMGRIPDRTGGIWYHNMPYIRIF